MSHYPTALLDGYRAHIFSIIMQSNDQITIGLMLKTMSVDQQKALVASLYHPKSSSYHQWLSSTQFSQMYTPSQSSIAAAQAFLTQSGLHLVASPDASLQLASGTTSQVEVALHTTINDYTMAHGNTYYGNSTNVQLPSSLSSSVLGVFGLSNVPVAQSYDQIDTSIESQCCPSAIWWWSIRKRPYPFANRRHLRF